MSNDFLEIVRFNLLISFLLVNKVLKKLLSGPLRMARYDYGKRTYGGGVYHAAPSAPALDITINQVFSFIYSFIL